MNKSKFLVLPVAALSLIGGGFVTANASTHLKNVVWNKKMGKHPVHYKNHYSVMWNVPASTSKTAHRVHYLKNYKHTTFTTSRHMKVKNGKVYYYIKAGHVKGWINRKYVKWGEADPKVQTGTWVMPTTGQSSSNNNTSSNNNNTPQIVYVPTYINSGSSSSSSNSSNNASSTAAQEAAKHIADAKKQGFEDTQSVKSIADLKSGTPKANELSAKYEQIKRDFGDDAANAYLKSSELGALLGLSQPEMKQEVEARLKDDKQGPLVITDSDFADAKTNGIKEDKIQQLKDLLKTPAQAIADLVQDVKGVTDANDPKLKQLKEDDVKYNSTSKAAYDANIEFAWAIDHQDSKDVVAEIKGAASAYQKSAIDFLNILINNNIQKTKAQQILNMLNSQPAK